MGRVLVSVSLRSVVLALIGVLGTLGMCTALMRDNWVTGSIAGVLWGCVVLGLHELLCELRGCLLKAMQPPKA